MMLSGGLPHSEIPGSKLILSSPGLIAEYHVLHRLLLPRHPPNALLALDLIQKEQDLRLTDPGLVRPGSSSFRSEVVHFPHASEEAYCLVSVLDLDKIAVSWPVTTSEANPMLRHVVARRSSPTGAISNSDV